MSLRSSLRLFWLPGALLASVGLAGSAAAYCIDPNFALLWGELPTPETIPVYVSIGPHTSVEHTGLTTPQVVRLTREIIARHNEAATGPALVYMGLTSVDMDYGPDTGHDILAANEGDAALTVNAMFAARPFGITVDSYDCEYAQQYQPCGADPKHRGCAKTARTHPKARVTLVPIGCNHGDDPHMLDANDLATVMLHEFGHALGLAHSQTDKQACELSQGHVHGNAVDGNEGVMRAQLGGNFPALREWRRDDIDGLAALYGPVQATELVAWNDAMFPASPTLAELVELPSMSARRPPATTSATMSSGALVYLATTDDDDRVIVYAHDTEAPSGLSSPELVDPSEAGRSWGNPGIAQSDEALFVVWSANERPDDSRVDLRWATRPFAGGEWTIADLDLDASTRVKRLAAGHVPLIDRFMVVSLSDYLSLPRYLLIDAAAELSTSGELDGPPMFDIGDPACVPHGSVARCLIPFSSNEFFGPKLSWLAVEIDELGVPWVLEAIPGEVDATGKLGFAGRPDLLGFRGSAGAQRYAIEDLAEAAPSPVPPPTIDGHSWPIVIASAWSGHELRWWGYARRRVECGDGLVQGLEQCDDGNLELGDGCSPSCLIEDEHGGDLEPGEALGDSETGGAGLDGKQDCDCRSTPSRAPLGLALLVLVSALRFRRRPRGGYNGRREPPPTPR